MSWGVDTDSFVCSEDSLEFHVQLFLHTGDVRITYIEGVDLFQVPTLTMSWGVDTDSFVCSEDSLEFHVQLFLHTGDVRITYIEGVDLFQVSLYNEEGNEVKRIDDVYLDNWAEVT